MFEKKPETTSVDVHHDLGVDLNYQAYYTGGPLKMGPPNMNNNIALKQGGPYVPEEFKKNGPLLVAQKVKEKDHHMMKKKE